MAEPPPYRVKQVEPVMAGADVLVRRLTLGPGEEIPWHRHTATDDLCVVLSGALRFERRDPDGECLMTPGDSERTPAGTAHRLSNPGPADCAFLLIQGVGQRDFVPLEPC
jgi:mannose-6-phosphate isomerase-like protein (cupin superfamily)